MQFFEYVTGQTEKAIRTSKGAWIPLSQIVELSETDDRSKAFTIGRATYNGIPHNITVTEKFAEKMKGWNQ